MFVVSKSSFPANFFYAKTVKKLMISHVASNDVCTIVLLQELTIDCNRENISFIICIIKDTLSSRFECTIRFEF